MARLVNLPEKLTGVNFFSITNSGAHNRLVVAFERLLLDHRSNEDCREMLTLNALEEILIVIAQEYLTSLKVKLDPRIDEVLNQIRERLSEELTVLELADLVSLSPSRLAHLFKEQTGDSIVNTLINLRLREASHLLEETTQNISEIAQKVGFQSQFHFSNQFKCHYGISPSAFRKKRL